jgi:hypothetical protein
MRKRIPKWIREAIREENLEGVTVEVKTPIKAVSAKYEKRKYTPGKVYMTGYVEIVVTGWKKNQKEKPKARP